MMKMVQCMQDFPIIRNWQVKSLAILGVKFFYQYRLAISPPVKLNLRLPIIERKHRTIDSFSDDEIKQNFRFVTKEQLHRVFLGLHFPDEVILPSRHRFHGQECFLVGLYRLRYPNTLYNADWISVFGLNYTHVSLIFNWFIRFISDRWGYLVADNVDYWTTALPYFADKIRLKANSIGGYNFRSALEPGGFRVFGFIDNTMFATCRPGGGPTSNGDRNDPLIQRSMYNGWKKIHGLKFQTVDLPNGMHYNVYGPVSVRHNDLYTLHHSNINNRIKEAQGDSQLQYVCYGDSAYTVVNNSHVKSRFVGDNICREERT